MRGAPSRRRGAVVTDDVSSIRVAGRPGKTAVRGA
jgi:hypothetical protein